MTDAASSSKDSYKTLNHYAKEPPNVTKNIGICFGGTGGQPEWAN